MRITIEIDGGEATVSAPSGEGGGEGAAEPGAPADVLAKAAAIGAQDAGAAPVGRVGGELPMSPAPAQPSGSGASGGADISAGTAPGSTREPEPTTVEAEDAGEAQGEES